MDLSLGLVLFTAFATVSSLPMQQSADSAYTSAEARDLHRTYQVRLAALVCAGVSLTSSLVVFYCFCRMDKLFRHRLIMILVYGDLTRATWYFVFAVYSLARGTVKKSSRFCQSSGFLIQYGTETSDYAVLVMAVHSALQVFRPAARRISDGLYQYRYYIYLGALILPSILASLAFINPDWAYLSQGAFCTLPIRPFWYRLALAWIPRYLIALIIIGLAIAIYAYVGFEFRSYANLTISQSANTTAAMTTSGLSPPGTETEAPSIHPEKVDDAPIHTYTRRASSVAHDIVSSQRRASIVAFMSATSASNRGLTATETQSLPESTADTPCHRTQPSRPPLIDIPSGHTIRPSNSGNGFLAPLSPTLNQDHDPLASSHSHPLPKPPSTRDASLTSPSKNHLNRQRQRIHRQLRLMFIYPLVYTLMWLIPFIQHCTMYSDHYANHPIWFFRIGATVFITSMGFVDCLVFSVREKPWRSIQTSDGTLLGSFAVWRSRSPCGSNAGLGNASVNCTDSVGLALERESTGGEGTALARIRSSVRTSASDDFTRIEMERARVRLDIEREERLAKLVKKIAKRRASVGVGSERGGEGGSDSEEISPGVEGECGGTDGKDWQGLGDGDKGKEEGKVG